MNDSPNPPSRAALIESLSEGQRACLRLVHQHKTSKTIARELSISKYTVDQRVERACRTLGAAGRGQAALMLAEYERQTLSERVVYDPVDIADPLPRTPSIEPQAETFSNEPQVAQVQAAYTAQPRNPGSQWSVGVPQGSADDLSIAQRVKWIVQLMISIIIAVLVLLAIAKAGSDLAEHLWPANSMHTD